MLIGIILFKYYWNNCPDISFGNKEHHLCFIEGLLILDTKLVSDQKSCISLSLH